MKLQQVVFIYRVLQADPLQKREKERGTLTITNLNYQLLKTMFHEAVVKSLYTVRLLSQITCLINV